MVRHRIRHNTAAIFVVTRVYWQSKSGIGRYCLYGFVRLLLRVTEKYRFEDCIHMVKDEIFMTGYCANGKRLVAALGNVALCKRTPNQ